MNIFNLIFVLKTTFFVASRDDPSFDVAYKHVRDREGFAVIGYLPTIYSGVTIGIGIDLGQQTKAILQSKGVAQQVISKCEKYLGIKSKAELDKRHLKAQDLVLTTQEANNISTPFIQDEYNKVKPYSTKMTSKGLAVLTSLKHWAGSLGCSKCKLSVTVDGQDINYIWNTIKNTTATNDQLKSSLNKTLAYKTRGTVEYNRIYQEYIYLN